MISSPAQSLLCPVLIGREVYLETMEQILDQAKTGQGQAILLEGELEAAIGQYERALKIASKIEDRNAEINILGGLFRAQALSGDVSLATKYGEQVIHLSRDINHTLAELTTIDALSSFFIEHGLIAQSLPHIHRGIALAGEQNDMIWQSNMLARLGQALYQQSELSQALENFKKALQIAESIDNQVIQAYVIGQMSNLYADLGEYVTSRLFSSAATKVRVFSSDTKNLKNSFDRLGESLI